MTSDIERFLLVTALMVTCIAALGAEYSVTSAYDATSQTWIGNVDALTNALKTAARYDTIKLSAGVYDLSLLTNAPMANPDGTGYGAALISVGQPGMHLKGATGKRDDVVIKATNSKYRLLNITGNSAKLSNVTMIGGNADAEHITASDKYKRGGGVFVCGNNVVISNCVFTGNHAHLDGGAVATVGDTPKSGSKLIDCKIASNSAGRHGGGVYNVERIEGCTITDNTSGKNGGGAYGGAFSRCIFKNNSAATGADRYNCKRDPPGFRITFTNTTGNSRLETIYTVPHELDWLVESGHIQGACCSEQGIYLSHSRGLDKIGWNGHLIKHIEVPAHLGDSAFADGRIYGACDIKDASLRVDGKPGLVRVWDENLNVVADAWFSESLDGITILGDTIYVGIAAASAPHGTNYVKRLGRDLSDKGNVMLDFGYWTKYGVQTMATDGSSIFFGNYGADADTGNPNGWNCTRFSPSLEVLENLKFPQYCSEGFALVPQSVAQRDNPVFLRIRNATSIASWNTADSPPQIKIEFFDYKNGLFTPIAN